MLTPMDVLAINDLFVSAQGKEILKGLNLKLHKGEIHVLMGPNGSGKSSLAATLMGHPTYQVTSGCIRYKGRYITRLSPDERAKLGIFLAFQNPLEIPGVTLSNFLRTAYNATHKDRVSIPEFKKRLHTIALKLKLEDSFLNRYLNDGFSGGEKKKAEALQLLVLEPKLVILDETDSGLDVDALKKVAKAISDYVSEECTILVITHYQRILKYAKPDFVHILVKGKIVESGKKELALEIEKNGYKEWEK